MATERRKVGEIRKAADAQIEARTKALELSKQEFASLQNITELERDRYNAMIDSQKERLRLDALQNEYQKDYHKLTTQQKVAFEKIITAQKKSVKKTNENLDIVKETNEELKKEKGWWDKIGGSIKELNSFIGGSAIWSFLMESDKGIKKTALQLGLSGERADILRYNIEQSAQYAARMGVSVTELAEAQARYSEETGRSLLMNEASLKAIVDMGKSTGIGVQDATALAAKYELIGIDAETSAKKVKGIVDTSERMGVSATKMLKKVSDNFSAINKFAFRDGVDSFSKMAMYAERFKVDMGSMLDSAEKARTLEGAVEMAAELQIMGGEFAKTDPFELLFLSRNDPEKYQKKINNMTKGIAQFRKTSKGAFEAYISPMDLDRLERAGKAVGLSREEMAKQAKQMLKMQSISEKLIGSGFDKEDRDMIAGMAQFSSETGKYFVNLKGATMDISKIGREQLKGLKAQSSELKDRTKASQTFDEAWQNTIMEFKATLLPMIQGINNILQAIRPKITWLMEGLGNIMGEGKAFLVLLGGAAAVLKIAASLISIGMSKFANIANINKLWEKSGSGKDGLEGVGGGTKSSGSATAKKISKNAGKGMMRGGAGIGAAALGIGAGVGAAAAGISLLADAMAKLDEKQLDTLQGVVLVLGGIMAVGIVAAVGIAALGTASAVAAPGLWAFGGAIALVGAGIGIAAAGIGYMAKGIATLGDPVVAENIGKTGEGLTGIMGAFSSGLLGGGVTQLLVGLGKFAMAKSYIADMAAEGAGMKDVGFGFQQIAAVMNGDIGNLDRLKDTLSTISEMDMGNNSVLSNLTKLLSQPLKVEFANNKVAINVDTTLELDGDILYRKVFSKRSNIVPQNDAKDGKDTQLP